MSVTAIIKLTAKPGKRAALMSTMAPAVEATRAQSSCLAVDLLACIEDPDDVLLIEHWTSVVAHETFIDGVIAAGGLDEIRPLLAAELQTRHYR